MYDTKGDNVLMNLSREKKNSLILYSIQNKRFSPFLSLSMFLERSYILGIFQPHVLIKKVLIKKRAVYLILSPVPPKSKVKLYSALSRYLEAIFLYIFKCLWKLRPSLDIVLSPHRTQFHLARCLARSKHGCDLDTVPN